MYNGARVRIREDSRYLGQCNLLGTINYLPSEEGKLNMEIHYTVTFENGYSNSYRIKDLDIIEDLKNIPNDNDELKMIDTTLKGRAYFTNNKILEIERSWRHHLTMKLENIRRLPFEGEYESLILGNDTLVKGYEGKLIINKLHYGKKMYLLMKPIKIKKFLIYAKYDKTGVFNCFVGTPVVGCHFIGYILNGVKFGEICTGNLKYKDPSSIENVEKISLGIVKSLEVINTHSLGKINPNTRRINKFWRGMNMVKNDRALGMRVLLKNNSIKEML